MNVRGGLREMCKCGHDKATHHEGKFNCLGLWCNTCKEYRNEWAEDQVEEPAPTTDPMPDSWDNLGTGLPGFPKGWVFP
jgi:hypothetical protein